MTEDFAAVERSVARFIDLSAIHLPYWEVLGRCLQGTLLIKRGEFAVGSRRAEHTSVSTRTRRAHTGTES